MTHIAMNAERRARLVHWSQATRWFAVVLVAYAVVFGGILIWADGLPYVLDGNEVFSNLIHARNWVEFGTGVTHGLADESTGLIQASHPFLHTHQGNMPRLTATLLYWLGVRSPESHIWLHVLLIGPLIMAAAYAFVLRVGGVWLAVSACLVLILDYVFFVQWQVNTYRMWGMFFVATGLALAEYANERTLRRSGILFFILFALLFYGELVFAAFCAILLGTYTVLRHFPRWRIILVSGFSMAAGACAGISIFVLQLLEFYGSENLVKDFTYTFLTRNETPDLRSIPEEVISFFNQTPIVFFYNVQDQSVLKTFGHFIESIAALQAAVYHPLIVVIAAVTILFLAMHRLSSRPHIVSKAGGRIGGALEAPVVLWMLSVCFLAFDLVVNQSLARFLFASSPEQFGAIRSVIFAAVCAMAVFHARCRPMALVLSQEDVNKRLLVSAAFGALVVICIRMAVDLFGPGLAGFWRVGGNATAQMGLGVAGWVVIWAMMVVLLFPRAGDFFPALRGLSLIKLGIASVLAYCAVFFVSAGYVFSGYLQRGQTFLVFQWAIFFGLAFAVLAHFVWHALGRLRHIRLVEGRTRGLRAVRGIYRDVSIGGLVGLALFVCTWMVHQARYVYTLPPTRLQFTQTVLRQPGIHGGTSVSNNYGLPFAYQMGNWSYTDYKIGAGRIVWNGERWEPELRSLIYLWFADRHSNKAYLWPDFYICYMPVGLLGESQRLLGQKSPDCFDMPLVQQAAEGRDTGIELVAAADTAPRRWAVLRFHWHTPPANVPDAGVTSRIAR